MSHTVSIIIPAYNRADLIGETLESVFAQTYTDYEVIVVDDGSTDKTEEILAPYRDRIRYIKQENSGVSVARNRGMLAAEGEFIAFLDSDDLWYPDKLEIQIEFMANHPEIGMTYTDYFLSDDPAKTKQSRMALYQADKHSLAEVLSHRSINLTSTVVFRRDLLPQIGLMDSVLYAAEDYDFWWKILNRTKVVFVDRILVFYREHPGRSVRAASKMLRGNIKSNAIQLARWKELIDPVLYENMAVYARQSIEQLGWFERKRGNIKEAGKAFIKASGTGKFHWSLFLRGMLLFCCPWVVEIKQRLSAGESRQKRDEKN